VSTAQIVGDLASDLKDRGYSVTVLTTTPHYNRDLEAETRQPMKNYWGPLLKTSDYGGVKVYHAIMPRKRSNILLRLLAWTNFHIISTIAAISEVSQADVIIAPSPPLTIGLCARMLARFYRVNYIYAVQEIYPDVAINLGAISNKSLIRLLLKLEKIVYRKAAAITVIASRMRQRLIEKGVPDEKVRVIPNFVDVDDLRPLPKDNLFSREHGVHDKFVVSYSGNMGPAQGLETFIEAAQLLQDDETIHFMMMGNGTLKQTFEKKVKQLGLRNFTFLPYQPYSLMPQIYATSDLCLVPLTAEAGSDAVPSKVYRIMASARPVLACASANTDLADLVSGAGCGLVVEPGSAESLANAIRQASRDPKAGAEMAEAGRKHVVDYYARPVVLDSYQRLIREVIADTPNSNRA
jgi:colanic acid biosynthesis glycosyl transferase WcaI